MDKVIESLKEALDDDAVVHISEAATRNGEYTTPYPIGYDVLDDAMRGGVRDGNLIVVTGFSNDGKTTLMSNLCVNLSKNNCSSLFLSYESVIDDLYAKFKGMGFYGEDLKVYTPKQTTTGNLDWVQDKIKEGVEKYNAKFIFIDDFDALSPKEERGSLDFRLRIRRTIIELKDMAVKMKIIIFVAVHVKKVFGRVVEMQDLKEDSSLFQKPDYILCITRETEIRKEMGKNIEVLTGNSNLRFLKNRFFSKRPKLEVVVNNDIILPRFENAEEIEVIDGKGDGFFGIND